MSFQHIFRAAAVVKRHINMYVAEGHKATTPEEFVDAGSSHGGVKGTTFTYASVISPGSQFSYFGNILCPNQ